MLRLIERRGVHSRADLKHSLADSQYSRAGSLHSRADHKHSWTASQDSQGDFHYSQGPRSILDTLLPTQPGARVNSVSNLRVTSPMSLRVISRLSHDSGDDVVSLLVGRASDLITVRPSRWFCSFLAPTLTICALYPLVKHERRGKRAKTGERREAMHYRRIKRPKTLNIQIGWQKSNRSKSAR